MNFCPSSPLHVIVQIWGGESVIGRWKLQSGGSTIRRVCAAICGNWLERRLPAGNLRIVNPLARYPYLAMESAPTAYDSRLERSDPSSPSAPNFSARGDAHLTGPQPPWASLPPNLNCYPLVARAVSKSERRLPAGKIEQTNRLAWNAKPENQPCRDLGTALT